MRKRGRKSIIIEKDHPFYCMASRQGTVPAARLIVATRIGRPLMKGEIVHHIDSNPENDSDDNLLLTNYKDHYLITARDMLKRKIIKMEGLLPLWKQELGELDKLVRRLL